jgi:putative flippase GtrA
MGDLWVKVESVLFTVLKKLFLFFHYELTEEMFGTFIEFIKFGIVGVSNTLVSYLIYVFSLLIIRKINTNLSIDYIIAQTIAFVLSVLWSFYWNNKMVFVKKENEKRSIWKSLLKTYISYSFTGLFLSNVLLVLWIHVLHISEFIAPLINLIVSVPLNFILNKFWAFKSE